MAKPMILYGLVDLVNPSFEDAGTPTGWDLASSINGVHTIDAAVAQSPGDGLPSVQSLKQNVAGGTAGNKAIARQRIAISQLPRFVNEGVVEVAAVASLKVARSIAGRNALLRLSQYDGTGTAAPGSGVLVIPPQERRFECGGPDWSMRVTAQKIHASAAYLDVALVYDIATGAYDANAHAWWDRVLVGVLIDLHKGFRAFDIDVDAGYEANAGMGVAEIVKIAVPQSRIDIDFVNAFEDLGEGGTTDAARSSLQLEQFSRWLAGPDASLLALWGDRNQLTNARRHFQMAYQDPSFSIEYPPGMARRNYSFRFIAPSEAP